MHLYILSYICIYIHTHTHKHRTIITYTYIQAGMHLHCEQEKDTPTYIYTYIHTHTHTHMHTHKHIYIYTCRWACMYVGGKQQTRFITWITKMQANRWMRSFTAPRPCAHSVCFYIYVIHINILVCVSANVSCCSHVRVCFYIILLCVVTHTRIHT